ncbi:Carboxylesterase NlhH [Stieleria neptunia]|uniref:Carboxylesterase NlhH n=1 Tax=Stieleria neptunia TaxID=2527979 RepID=A0A518HMS0_9BACT|nr:alpha/beta hydrolase [Stieleria neptunia]QDV42067.1 Carboxylesterase NlhH [Stieleria neptunia]
MPVLFASSNVVVMRRFSFCLLLVFSIGRPAYSAEPAIQRDLSYAKINGVDLKLDFYPSQADGVSPLIVWVHGGAWRAGDKRNVPIKRLTGQGFSIATLNYRLSGTARFPAQTEDIKAGIRFLRAHAARFEIDPDRIVIAGASAGGHLAALVGVSDGVQTVENLAMGNAEISSHVSAIVSLYGASNLLTILSQSTPHGLSDREPALKLLLGDLPTGAPEAARLASPVQHVDPSDPPLLLIHGDQDPQMPINQSHELEGAYQRAGLDVTFHVLHGAAHGGNAFYDDQHLKLIADWIRSRLD